MLPNYPIFLAAILVFVLMPIEASADACDDLNDHIALELDAIDAIDNKNMAVEDIVDLSGYVKANKGQCTILEENIDHTISMVRSDDPIIYTFSSSLISKYGREAKRAIPFILENFKKRKRQRK